MTNESFNSTIAEHQALQITLRDDLARFGTVLCGESLTTVMGPAYHAGVMEPAETVVRLMENNVLEAMLGNVSDKVAARSMIAKLICEATETAARKAVADAQTRVETQIMATMGNLINKTGSTVTAIEAAAKKLLAGAEAKANVITRKRQEAQVNFQTNLELVRTRIELIGKLEKRAEQMTADLNDVSTDVNMSTEEMYKRIAQISVAQKAIHNQMDIAKSQIIIHFGDQAGAGKHSKELISLTIPENIEEGKGKEFMENFLSFINGRAEQFYATLPYLLLVLEDYDHATGACFKPPCIEDKIGELPEEIRSSYLIQSKNLYLAIWAKLSDQVKSLAKATFEYGTEETPARCAENDGPNLLFALICMFRPCNMEYTEELESTLIDAHHAFQGADPREVIKELRAPLQEAQTLQIPIKWNQSGKRIVDTLIHEDHNMAEALKGFKKLDIADKDCTAHLDKLFAAVEAQCKRNEKHEGKLSAFSMRTNKPQAAITDRDTQKGKRDTSKIECRFGSGCTRRPKCPFLHSNNKNNKSKPSGPAQAQPCMGIKCPEKASKGKKLCTTCFMKACEQGELKLNDGSIFTSHRPGGNGNNMSKNQINELKKAFAVMHQDSEDEEDIQNAPSSVGGPACSAKRKRANTAKEVEDANKRVKDFAESLGIQFE